MKALPVSLMLLSASLQALAQDSNAREHHIGLDIISSLPSYLFQDDYFIRKALIIEPYYLFDTKRPRRRAYLGAGLARGSSHELNTFTPSQKFWGTYAKAALEFKTRRFPKRLRVGYGPIVSVSGYEGHYVFEGPAFGDYVQPYKTSAEWAFGLESYFALDFKLGRKLMLRALARNVTGLRTGAARYVLYYPGMGYNGAPPGGNLLFTINASVQLFYKLN